ncbi:MAG: helix-turn-helix domain-containing protein [Chitinophagales bacterium]|jgi:transcriptional regulator with XRE-family HTH domain|nr:helix-turn-helix transcriptional regulator [Sphingobacteriales bacterium]
MTVKKILDNIKEWRERKKQYSQAYLGQRMGITQKAYSKIETGETKLTVLHLIQISDVLEVELREILELESAVIYHPHAHHPGNSNALTPNMDTESKVLYEKLIASKDKEIEILRRYIDRLEKGD